ncbi:MAG: hypothetical protein LBE13_01900 [Bacteroidales bacterium]|jgi:hypothetical protein|nr:hypothetical protein [Bacteroidales bacterium]
MNGIITTENMLLTRSPSREECIEYLRNEGILEYFNIGEKKEQGIFDAVDKNNKTPFAPVPEDLYRLHTLVRRRKVFNVLEFGLGFSTIVMADALKKNKDDFYSSNEQPEIRITQPFKLYSVDASEYWIDTFSKKYSKIFPYFDILELTYSKCNIGEHCGQICHFYMNIPNVITDFIYLDGPSGHDDDVQGSINGLSFIDCLERTVISGDLLKMESTLLPGTMIIVDGRVNNVRFLKNNLKRSYNFEYIDDEDISVFELCELPLGKINRNQINYSLGENYYKREREREREREVKYRNLFVVAKISVLHTCV